MVPRWYAKTEKKVDEKRATPTNPRVPDAKNVKTQTKTQNGRRGAGPKLDAKRSRQNIIAQTGREDTAISRRAHSTPQRLLSRMHLHVASRITRIPRTRVARARRSPSSPPPAHTWATTIPSTYYVRCALASGHGALRTTHASRPDHHQSRRHVRRVSRRLLLTLTCTRPLPGGRPSYRPQSSSSPPRSA